MKLYNTPSRAEVELKLDDSKPVKLYTCGPTVYDYPHIGNWYTFIRYDMLHRVLQAHGYKTEWVMNITDVGHLVSDADDGEDKLEKGAAREGKTAWDIAAFYSNYFVEGMKRLNFSAVTHLPKATDFIPQQIDLVKRLEEKGYTYQISDGVYFDTSKFPNYADFAHLNLAEQEEGARGQTNQEKRNPSDFALWKLSPNPPAGGHQRDMEWDSPWGKGFPGWHLECSAMIHEILGDPIDIHAGGVDHIPVHHTNEIAQTEAAYDVPLSRYWMHCNHIMVNGAKMSKSDGTFITLEDIETKGFSLDAFRLHVLSGHYRSQSEFSWELLQATQNRLIEWQNCADLRFQTIVYDDERHPMQDLEFASHSSITLEALENDLNTPIAVAEIYQGLEQAKLRNVDNNAKDAFIDYLECIHSLTGINLLKTHDITDEQKQKISERDKIKKAGDYEKSDQIRLELEADGVLLRDTNHGAIWSRRI